MLFGADCWPDMQKKVKGILNIARITSEEKYLGATYAGGQDFKG
jgi:hypothetical protein